jgi:3-oxoacyl-[acyl-carrier protein] reductase
LRPGWKPAPETQYGAAKAAKIALAATLTREPTLDRIRVTPLSLSSSPVARISTVHNFPAKRLGTAEAIADVITFLLSERASWVNRVNTCVDGAQGRPNAAGW